jgi:hypothetical protein
VVNVRFQKLQKFVVGQSAPVPLHNQSAKKRRVIRSAAAKNLLRINGASVFAAQFKSGTSPDSSERPMARRIGA